MEKMTVSEPTQLHRYCFATYETPHCVWEYDLDRVNRGFLDSLEPAFFSGQADILHARVLSADDIHAATALRALYLQGLEAMFALLGSALQAPGAVPAWLLRYRTRELRELVQAIQDGRPVLTRWTISSITWESISCAIHGAYSGTCLSKDQVIAGYSELWRGLAGDFLDQDQQHEFNSIKHAYRIRAGGFRLAVGPQDDPETPAKPERMQSLGGSKFGSAYFIPQRLSKSGTDFRLRQVFRNWSPQNLLHGLSLCAMSMNNILSFLRYHAGTPAEQLRIMAPLEKEHFSLPWSDAIGAVRFDMALGLRPEDIEPSSAKEILSVYGDNR